MQVILAIDGSPSSLQAAHYLASLPFREKLDITVVTALIDSQFDLVTNDAGLQIREVEHGTARENYERVRQILEPRTVHIEHLIERKHPSQLILETAQQRNADLVVLGSVGHSAIYRITLGSTADYVANHAKCSTLVVRQPAADSATPSTVQWSSVLLAYDGSPAAQEAFAQIQNFDWPPSTKIHLTTLLERPKLLPEDEVYDPQLISEKEKELKQLSQASNLKCEISYAVSETLDIGSALCSACQKQKCDLIFIGDSARSAFFRFFLGSTSRYLAHHTHGPLWIARRKQWNS